MLAALAEAAGGKIPKPIAVASHRWRYALSAGTGDGALWNPDIGLGVCGDWLLGPRVECAWLSGRLLAQARIRPIADRLYPCQLDGRSDDRQRAKPTVVEADKQWGHTR
jgi:hypothetical protein